MASWGGGGGEREGEILAENVGAPPQPPTTSKTRVVPNVFCLLFSIFKWANLPFCSGGGWRHSHSPSTAWCFSSWQTGQGGHSLLHQRSVTGDLRVVGVNRLTAGVGRAPGPAPGYFDTIRGKSRRGHSLLCPLNSARKEDGKSQHDFPAGAPARTSG